MARASYVYLVSTYGDANAAFTVKHECVTWLSRRFPNRWAPLRVFRVPDGGAPISPIDVTEDFYPTKGTA